MASSRPPESPVIQSRRNGTTDNVVRRWRASLDWLMSGLTATGALWLIAKYVLATPTDFGPVSPPWSARVLALHGGLAMLSLLAVGGWFQVHVAPRLKRPAGRVTGYIQIAALAILILTGFALYYVADEVSRPTWSTLHWVCGLVLATLLLVHRRRARSGA